MPKPTMTVTKSIVSNRQSLSREEMIKTCYTIKRVCEKRNMADEPLPVWERLEEPVHGHTHRPCFHATKNECKEKLTRCSMTFPRTGDKKLTKKQSTKKVTKKNKKNGRNERRGCVKEFNSSMPRHVLVFFTSSQVKRKKSSWETVHTDSALAGPTGLSDFQFKLDFPKIEM